MQDDDNNLENKPWTPGMIFGGIIAATALIGGGAASLIAGALLMGISSGGQIEPGGD